jgi:Spy/CpxP family protein refolding chaperone
MKKAIAIVGVILVFIIGALVGFLGTKVCSRPLGGEFAKGGLLHPMCGHRMERFAEGRPMPFMHGGGMEGCKKIINELGLTADQKKKVDDILTKNQDERKKLMDSFREAKKQFLSTVVSAKEFDEAAFRKGFQQVSSIKENLAVLRAKMIPELKAVLTPEQIGYLKGRMDAKREFCKKDCGRLRRGQHPNLAESDRTPQTHQEQGEEPNS